MSAIDLSHHLNTLSLSRNPSPLKHILEHLENKAIISLAGGLPHPSLFPYASIEVDVYDPEADLTSLVSSDVIRLRVAKYGESGDIDLARVLQYAQSTGIKSLLDFAREFAMRVSKPAYSNFDVLMNMGNTDGWTKIVSLLCEYGDYIVVEEFTYPTAQAIWIPMGCKGVPIKMDAYGLRVDLLEETLENWNETHPGIKMPHVIYMVPTGHNPTGCVITSQRKKEIYDICVKYDLIIVEDDPYYFLQFEHYVPGKVDGAGSSPAFEEKVFLDSLERTFLSYDTQGRVIRIDSFSKTLSPGSRIGWFTANPVFCERLLRASEAMVQSPSGWSQAIISKQLQEWTLSGYLRWVSRLRLEYQVRRTWMCDAIAHSFDVIEGEDGESLVAYLKGEKTRLFSFVPARTGMFIWAKVHVEENPGFLALEATSPDPEADYEKALFAELIQGNILLAPGGFYSPWQGKEKATTSASGRETKTIHFRLCYSTSTKQDTEAGVQRMADVFRAAWTH